MKHLHIWVFSILFLVINHSSFSHGDDSNHKFRQRKVTNDDLNYPEMVSRYLKTGKLEVPHRKVRKDWYVGLHPDAVDCSHLDVRDDLHIEEATKINETNENKSESNFTGSTSLANHSSKANMSEAENEKKINANTGSVGSNERHAESNSGRSLLQDNTSKDSQEGSFVLNENAGEATVGNDQALVTTGDPSSKSFRDSDQLGYGYNGYNGYYGYYGSYSPYGYYGYYDCYGYYHYCGHR